MEGVLLLGKGLSEGCRELGDGDSISIDETETGLWGALRDCPAPEPTVRRNALVLPDSDGKRGPLDLLGSRPRSRLA